MIGCPGPTLGKYHGSTEANGFTYRDSEEWLAYPGTVGQPFPTGQRSTVGDVGCLGKDGYLHLTDSKTYMIISAGVSIYPQQIENRLITRAKVLDAAVFGVPNADLGEEVMVVVQVAEGVTPGPELELIEFGRQELAHSKRPVRSTSTPSCRASQRASCTSPCCPAGTGAMQPHAP